MNEIEAQDQSQQPEECQCNPDGSITLKCDSNGDCACKEGFSGNKCDECEPEECNCSKDPFGTQVGDKECDDVTNNEECNYDGGDCCMDNVNTDHCTECICKQ